MDGAIRLSEVFDSIQGEGANLGCPSIFIRLQGCTVGCSWCDTKYSWPENQGKLMTYTEIMARINPGRNIVITGGEPLEHPDFMLLIRKIKEHQMRSHIEIETSGTVVPTLEMTMPWIDQWNVGLKLKNSGVPIEKRLNGYAIRGFQQLGQFYGCQVWWKFATTGSQEEIDEVKWIQDHFGLFSDRIILMPLTDLNPATQMVTMIPRAVKVWEAASRMMYRYTPRAHEIFGLKRGI